MSTVYALIDPRDAEVRYVGLTSMRVEARLARHLSTSASVKVSAWVKEIKSSGMVPQITVLEDNILDELEHETETFWINFMKNTGAKLLNVEMESKKTQVRFDKAAPPNAGHPRVTVIGCDGADFIHIKLNPVEKKRLDALAVERGRTVSEYIKNLILGAAPPAVECRLANTC